RGRSWARRAKRGRGRNRHIRLLLGCACEQSAPRRGGAQAALPASHLSATLLERCHERIVGVSRQLRPCRRIQGGEFVYGRKIIPCGSRTPDRAARIKIDGFV